MGRGRLIHHVNFSRIETVLPDAILLARLRNGNDGVGAAAEKGHGEIEEPVVELFMVFGEQLVDQVVDGEDGRHAAQGQQQVFRAVEQFRARGQPVETDSGHLPGQDERAPGFVAQADVAGRDGRGERGGKTAVAPPVIKQSKAPRLRLDQRPRQPLRIPPQPRPAVNGR